MEISIVSICRAQPHRFCCKYMKRSLLRALMRTQKTPLHVLLCHPEPEHSSVILRCAQDLAAPDSILSNEISPLFCHRPSFLSTSHYCLFIQNTVYYFKF